MIKALIFDLDGVLVDTATFHYLAWKEIAQKFDLNFTEKENENLKGVSRTESLEYILKLANVSISDSEKLKFCHVKNQRYLELIQNLGSKDLLPGSKELIDEAIEKGYKIALGSASKNAIPVLKSTSILKYFDSIVDGNLTTRSKPDPQVFLLAAKELGMKPHECIVFEDSIKGVEAATKGGFITIGVGESETLVEAHYVVGSLEEVDLEKFNNIQLAEI